MPALQIGTPDHQPTSGIPNPSVRTRSTPPLSCANVATPDFGLVARPAVS
jgi:hypothetical protein